MKRFSNNPSKNAQVLQALREQEEILVETAKGLADELAQVFKREEKASLNKDNHKERQLRNIQAVAEQSASWAELELFIRYQAARGEIYVSWAQKAIQSLGDLQNTAQSIVPGDKRLAQAVHMELVRRTLGYTVRWHVWHAKGATQQKGN